MQITPKPKPKGRARKVELEKDFPSDDTLKKALILAALISPVLLNILKGARGKASARQIRAAITKLMLEAERRMRAASERLTKAEIKIPEWQTEMSGIITDSHTVAASAGAGGTEAMTAAKWSAAAAITALHFRYLYNFARQVEQRRLSEKQIITRSGSYSKAVRSTYYAMEKEGKKEAGFTTVRRELNAMESCAGCTLYASVGFIPIDEMPDIGDLECGSFCRCELIYQ